jgi:transglutaminase-like putative cysteine protease
MTDATPDTRDPKATALAAVPALTASLAVALVPHLNRLPVWTIAWCAAAWGWVLFCARTGRPLPGRAVRLGLTVVGVVLVLVNFGTAFDRFAGITLLWITASIKPMEIQSRRDVMVTVFLVYFLAASVLFFSSSLAVGIYLLLAVCFISVVLIRVNHPGGSWQGHFRLGLKILLQALPLALVLFVFFPRFQGSLWGRYSPGADISGFSESLEPGSVSQLVLNDAVAFRVRFSDGVPPARVLYWRGVTFWDTDGRRWLKSAYLLRETSPPEGGNIVEYTVFLEPHQQHWLFALDLPLEAPPDGYLQADHTLASFRRIRQPVRYNMSSVIDYRTENPGEWTLAALQLPDRTNPRTRELARGWRRAGAGSEAVVENALRFLGENGFRYTLQPPPLGENAVDDFLFGTRQGYCEHFAAAFAFLMRAAGVPSRIVAGYQGGDFNPYGGYLIVRQSHAHAWVEVWLRDKGWVRVDPTLAVAPQRAETGVAAALPPEEQSAVEPLQRFGRLSGPWKRIQLGWDVLNNQWNSWVLGYTYLRQKSVLAQIGVDIGRRIGSAVSLSIALAVAGLLFAFYAFRPPAAGSADDGIQRSYLEFCRRLSRQGLPREPWRGPMAYAERVCRRRPDLADSVLEIARLYVRLRYESGATRHERRQFVRAVARFVPKSAKLS